MSSRRREFQRLLPWRAPNEDIAVDVPLEPGPIPPDEDGAFAGFPWWLLVVGGLIVLMIWAVVVDDNYREAWDAIKGGVTLTVWITLASFVVSLALGLAIALARMSKSRILETVATAYIEIVRGVPFIVWIFLVAFVFVREFANLTNVSLQTITSTWRGIIALSLFYAAFIAEVIRAGIQSVPHGQTEAAMSVGLHPRQILRRIVLPQAIRNMLPALGNDLIALFKDTALLSVIAVQEVTQLARIYSGSSFRFRETFFVLTVFYLTLTLGLSLLLRWYENRITIPGQRA